MKVFVALFVLVAVASANLIVPGHLGYNLGYSSVLQTPLAYHHAIATPYVATHVVAAPAIQSGYVAATRGSLHTAPLPEGPHAFSHHINTAPAPGTL